jgi:hypothetical protein
LVSYFGLDDPRSADDQQALRAAMATIAPELAADWPTSGKPTAVGAIGDDPRPNCGRGFG